MMDGVVIRIDGESMERKQAMRDRLVAGYAAALDVSLEQGDCIAPFAGIYFESTVFKKVRVISIDEFMTDPIYDK